MRKNEPITLEHDGGVAVITLDSPPLNLFNEAAFQALPACVDEVAKSDARALVWRGAGEVFSGGVDVHEFQKLNTDGAAEVFASLIRAVRQLESLEIPTLALANGLCLTAALEVSLGCDMIWAAESAQFGLVEAVIGLTPGAGGTQRMAERAGPGRAREFVMTRGLYPATTLEAWGVVNRVVPDAELMEKGMRFAHKLADGPTKAHAATKRIVRGYLEGGVDEADRITPEVSGGLFATEDLQKAVESFLTEGPGNATFEGR